MGLLDSLLVECVTLFSWELQLLWVELACHCCSSAEAAVDETSLMDVRALWQSLFPTAECLADLF